MSLLFGKTSELKADRGFTGRSRLKTLTTTYTISLNAYPALHVNRQDLESGNKILLPSTILTDLAGFQLPHPMIFNLQNIMIGNSANVGVLEFTSKAKECILPNWLFEQLGLDYEGEVYLTLLQDVSKGKAMKLQPYKTEFLELPDPKATLEKQLSHYACLTVGDVITVKVSDEKSYLLNVLEVSPKSQNNCICVIDTDIELDITRALDYVEKPKQQVFEAVNLDSDEEEKEEVSVRKEMNANGEIIDVVKEKITNEVYDPRKYRLVNGLRGVKNEENKVGEKKRRGPIIGGTKPKITF